MAMSRTENEFWKMKTEAEASENSDEPQMSVDTWQIQDGNEHYVEEKSTQRTGEKYAPPKKN